MMRILAVDDERLALDLLAGAIREAAPEAELHTFFKAGEALSFAQDAPCDAAFLDIQMRAMTGLELARRLKEVCPDVNIIFVTGYREYAFDAMELHASGYIEKPATAEKVRYELSNLRHTVVPELPHAVLRVVCFGNFTVYTGAGELLHFERAKSKECFAYLVSRCGNPCSVRELAGILFEDMPYDHKQANYVQQIITALMKSLREAGAKQVIRKSYNALSVDPALLDCDYYRFCAGESAAVNSYQGEFMLQYSWAEFITGRLG